MDRAGLPRVWFHDLRHSGATFLISQGVPLAFVSKVLGHSSIRITVDLYGHLETAPLREVAETFERLFESED
jgi:integrase